ncbi:MAG: MaoC family dehydratase [Parvibaculum sp.]|nr:MaoC family dehydratase [Parvibaculum sp.]|tara:strand:- start:4078 stop:4518 length:441 start_codon:yes stop_codon:yes gene_type:complete
MTDFSGYCIEDLSLGMESTFTKVISDADITAFAGVSGDTNPVHLNDVYASKTMFGGRIAHGMLSASLISAVIGTQLPGPGAIYMSQSLRFRAPVKPGDEVSAHVVISALDEKRRRVTLTCTAHVGDTLVIDGEAMVMVPSKEARPA